MEVHTFPKVGYIVVARNTCIVGNVQANTYIATDYKVPQIIANTKARSECNLIDELLE